MTISPRPAGIKAQVKPVVQPVFLQILKKISEKKKQGRRPTDPQVPTLNSAISNSNPPQPSIGPFWEAFPALFGDTPVHHPNFQCFIDTLARDSIDASLSRASKQQLPTGDVALWYHIGCTLAGLEGSTIELSVSIRKKVTLALKYTAVFKVFSQIGCPQRPSEEPAWDSLICPLFRVLFEAFVDVVEKGHFKDEGFLLIEAFKGLFRHGAVRLMCLEELARQTRRRFQEDSSLSIKDSQNDSLVSLRMRAIFEAVRAIYEVLYQQGNPDDCDISFFSKPAQDCVAPAPFKYHACSSERSQRCHVCSKTHKTHSFHIRSSNTLSPVFVRMALVEKNYKALALVPPSTCLWLLKASHYVYACLALQIPWLFSPKLQSTQDSAEALDAGCVGHLIWKIYCLSLCCTVSEVLQEHQRFYVSFSTGQMKRTSAMISVNDEERCPSRLSPSERLDPSALFSGLERSSLWKTAVKRFFPFFSDTERSISCFGMKRLSEAPADDFSTYRALFHPEWSYGKQIFARLLTVFLECALHNVEKHYTLKRASAELTNVVDWEVSSSFASVLLKMWTSTTVLLTAHQDHLLFLSELKVGGYRINLIALLRCVAKHWYPILHGHTHKDGFLPSHAHLEGIPENTNLCEREAYRIHRNVTLQKSQKAFSKPSVFWPEAAFDNKIQFDLSFSCLSYASKAQVAKWVWERGETHNDAIQHHRHMTTLCDPSLARYAHKLYERVSLIARHVMDQEYNGAYHNTEAGVHSTQQSHLQFDSKDGDTIRPLSRGKFPEAESSADTASLVYLVHVLKVLVGVLNEESEKKQKQSTLRRDAVYSASVTASKEVPLDRQTQIPVKQSVKGQSGSSTPALTVAPRLSDIVKGLRSRQSPANCSLRTASETPEATPPSPAYMLSNKPKLIRRPTRTCHCFRWFNAFIKTRSQQGTFLSSSDSLLLYRMRLLSDEHALHWRAINGGTLERNWVLSWLITGSDMADSSPASQDRVSSPVKPEVFQTLHSNTDPTGIWPMKETIAFDSIPLSVALHCLQGLRDLYLGCSSQPLSYALGQNEDQASVGDTEDRLPLLCEPRLQNVSTCPLDWLRFFEPREQRRMSETPSKKNYTPQSFNPLPSTHPHFHSVLVPVLLALCRVQAGISCRHAMLAPTIRARFCTETDQEGRVLTLVFEKVSSTAADDYPGEENDTRTVIFSENRAQEDAKLLRYHDISGLLTYFLQCEIGTDERMASEAFHPGLFIYRSCLALTLATWIQADPPSSLNEQHHRLGDIFKRIKRWICFRLQCVMCDRIEYTGLFSLLHKQQGHISMDPFLKAHFETPEVENMQKIRHWAADFLDPTTTLLSFECVLSLLKSAASTASGTLRKLCFSAAYPGLFALLPSLTAENIYSFGPLKPDIDTSHKTPLTSGLLVDDLSAPGELAHDQEVETICEALPPPPLRRGESFSDTKLLMAEVSAHAWKRPHQFHERNGTPDPCIGPHWRSPQHCILYPRLLVLFLNTTISLCPRADYPFFLARLSSRLCFLNGELHRLQATTLVAVFFEESLRRLSRESHITRHNVTPSYHEYLYSVISSTSLAVLAFQDPLEDNGHHHGRALGPYSTLRQSLTPLRRLAQAEPSHGKHPPKYIVDVYVVSRAFLLKRCSVALCALTRDLLFSEEDCSSSWGDFVEEWKTADSDTMKSNLCLRVTGLLGNIQDMLKPRTTGKNRKQAKVFVRSAIAFLRLSQVEVERLLESLLTEVTPLAKACCQKLLDTVEQHITVISDMLQPHNPATPKGHSAVSAPSCGVELITGNNCICPNKFLDVRTTPVRNRGQNVSNSRKLVTASDKVFSETPHAYNSPSGKMSQCNQLRWPSVQTCFRNTHQRSWTPPNVQTRRSVSSGVPTVSRHYTSKTSVELASKRSLLNRSRCISPFSKEGPNLPCANPHFTETEQTSVPRYFETTDEEDSYVSVSAASSCESSCSLDEEISSLRLHDYLPEHTVHTESPVKSVSSDTPVGSTKNKSAGLICTSVKESRTEHEHSPSHSESASIESLDWIELDSDVSEDTDNEQNTKLFPSANRMQECVQEIHHREKHTKSRNAIEQALNRTRVEPHWKGFIEALFCNGDALYNKKKHTF